MKFSLNTSIVRSDDKDEIKNAIILLHGYGGDGNDISSLTHSWKRHLSRRTRQNIQRKWDASKQGCKDYS